MKNMVKNENVLMNLYSEPLWPPPPHSNGHSGALFSGPGQAVTANYDGNDLFARKPSHTKSWSWSRSVFKSLKRQ